MKITKHSELVSLEDIHIFEYYDFPLFFISKSPEDEYYLNYYVEEVADNTDKWLFSRISNKERINLIEQRTSVLEILKSLFAKQRLYHLYVDSTLSQSDADLTVELVNANNFDAESFPEEDFYVEYDFITSQSLIKVEEDVLDSSRFKIVLRDVVNSHDIGLDFLMDIFANFKKALNDMAYDVGKKVLGAEAINPINLRVDSVEPSSFGVWIKAESEDLFEVPDKSLSSFFEIIEDIATKEQKEIEEQIEIDESYSLETIKSIKNMLKNVSENEFTFKLKGTTKSNGAAKEVEFDRNSYDKLDMLINILQDRSETSIETIEIEGELTSVNTSRNYFKIQTGEIDITGIMSRELFRRLKSERNVQFRVPSAIKATVEKKTINDLVNDESSVKYTLVSFEQPD
ncbi:hypothetical protein PY144_14825 [Bacillus cereus]|uniref:hypothetical protein n=1 Tax=Bacillus cereus group TaxID=86661 RepID=UPI001F573D1E